MLQSRLSRLVSTVVLASVTGPDFSLDAWGLHVSLVEQQFPDFSIDVLSGTGD